MSNFNWQTEDDVSWDDLEPVVETAVPRRHPWLTYGLIVAGIITAGILIYRQVNQRIEAATANATSDILASHNLVQQASAGQDVELFNTLLSGVDDAWVEAQSELVRQNGLLDRSAFDFTRLSSDTAVTQADVDNGTINIELNPELNAAELTFPQDYVVNVGNGVTETVQLRQTAVYRLGAQRWLYAPPDADFWGEFESTTGAMLSLAYPGRDKEVAERLAFDLDAKLNEMCRTIAEINCPDGLEVHLRLEDNAKSLIRITTLPTAVLSSRLFIRLPTPTIVGMPVDEAGYQALYRGYAIHLISAVTAELTGYECCSHVAYFQALLDYQLDELGLRPLTLDRADYERVVRENIGVEELDAAWRSAIDLKGEDGWLVVTAVDFIHQELPHTAIANLQRQMNRRRRLVDWLSIIASESAVTTDEGTAFMLSRRWQPYALEQYQAQQEPPPLPLPTQDIYLLCTLQQGEAISELYQYKLADSEWVRRPLDVSALSMNPLPDDEAFLLQDFREELRTWLWQDGDSQLLFENDMITFGQFDPTGQYLLVYGIGEEAVSINQIDWAACVAGDCTIEPLGGNLVWSPQGTDFIMLPAESLGQEPFGVNGRTILFNPSSAPFEWPLYRGNGQPPTSDLADLTRFGTGFAPFWVDEATFGYIRQIRISSNSNRREIVMIDMADDLPQSILTETDLQRGLPDGLPVEPLLLRYVIPHPQQPDLLFIGASVNDREMEIFSYHIQTNDVQFLLQTGSVSDYSVSFSPDGRYLIVTGTDDESQLFGNPRNSIYFYDLVTNQTQTFAGTNLMFSPSNTYDWSADGQWLVATQENQMMALIAPAYNYQQFIPHNLGDCANVAWMNQ